MEDAAIVELYLCRNEAAIEHSARKYGSRLRGIGLRMLEDHGAAEECENETYLRAWNLIPPNEPRNYLFAFLGKIMRHLCIDECRRDSRRKHPELYIELTEELAACTPSGARTEERLEAEELVESVNRFLAGCTEDQRRVFVRRYWFFDSIQQIARRFGFSQGKVKSMLFRLREELRQQLREEGYAL